MIVYNITPVAKPRQTRSDKWRQRPCVMRYRAFADECRLNKVVIPEHGAHITFYIPMPKSWSKKKKSTYENMSHQQKPDWDNLAKAICDAVLKDDSGIWDVRITKLWAYKGSIEIMEEDI